MGTAVRRWGVTMWVANAAGWLVLAHVTQLPVAVGVAIACLIAAIFWEILL